jgi:hypothetical protein
MAAIVVINVHEVQFEPGRLDLVHHPVERAAEVVPAE